MKGERDKGTITFDECVIRDNLGPNRTIDDLKPLVNIRLTNEGDPDRFCRALDRIICECFPDLYPRS